MAPELPHSAITIRGMRGISDTDRGSNPAIITRGFADASLVPVPLADEMSNKDLVASGSRRSGDRSRPLGAGSSRTAALATEVSGTGVTMTIITTPAADRKCILRTQSAG